MAKSDAERKRDERNRMRREGFVLRQLWVHQKDLNSVNRFAEQKRRKRTADGDDLVREAVGYNGDRETVL